MKLLKEIRNSHTTAPSEVDLVALENARDFPTFVYCRHMQPGLVGYKDERILVDADTIKRMLPTMKGKPVFLNHQNVELDEMKEKASGYVTEAFYNELDGWGWAKIMLIDDAAKDAARAGWSVSNAYVPTNWAGKGLNNNVAYDRAITDGKFTHLALVKDPRYEQAKIFTPEAFESYQVGKRQQISTLRNSKENGKGTQMFEFFKKTKEAVTTVDAETVVVITNDKGEKVEMTIADMANAIQNAKPAAEAPAAPTADELANSKVKVGDKEMTVTELVAAFGALQNSKPAEAPAAPVAPVVAAAPAAPAAKPAAEHFKELSNANKGADKVVTVDTQTNKVQRGKQRYGTI